jgi:hypothetical protein
LHDKNVNVEDEGEEFILNTFVKQLETGTVELPDGPNGELIPVKISDLGIKYPVVVTNEEIKTIQYWSEAMDGDSPGAQFTPPARDERGTAAPGAAGSNGAADNQPELWKLRQYDFIIQFCWQETPRGQRFETRQGAGPDGQAPDETAEGAAPGTAAVDQGTTASGS